MPCSHDGLRLNPGERGEAPKMTELLSLRTDCVDCGSRLGCSGAYTARFGMKEKESNSSLHLISGLLWPGSGGHEEMTEQNQAIGTRQRAQEVTFSPRASTAVPMTSCHLHVVTRGLPQVGESKKRCESEGLLPWASQHNQRRPPHEQTKFAALTVKD